MRKLIGILLLLLASGSFAQGPIVQLHHTIGMRYYLKNQAVHSFLYNQVAKHIELSYDFEYVKSQFYHTNYLYHEPFTWAKPITRKVELTAQDLSQGDPGWDGVTPFDAMIKELGSRSLIQAFKWEGFVFRYEYAEQDSMLKAETIDTEHILVKELWHKNLKTRDLERHISAIAILNEQGKEMMWIPFDEIRYELRNYRTYVNGNFIHYEDYILNALYPSSEVVSSAPTKCVEYYSDDDFGAELDVLYEIEELKLQSAWSRSKGLKKGSFKSKNMQFQEKNGLIHGDVKWIGSDGFNYTANFKNGKVEGRVEATDKDKNLRLQANLEAGQLEGKMNTFFDNGLVQHDYRFKANVPDSVQNVYFSHGQLMYNYSFKNGEMHGKYERYTGEGVLNETGNFKDGVVEGNWEIHHEFGRIFCLYFKETDFQWTRNENLDPQAFDDCTFDAFFYLEYMKNPGCPEGFCVIPRLDGMIR